jgi:hypothetical protein
MTNPFDAEGVKKHLVEKHQFYTDAKSLEVLAMAHHEIHLRYEEGGR